MFEPWRKLFRGRCANLSPMTVTVVVMGPSGVGKSAVAGELVARTGWTFAEGDDLHSEANRAKMAAGHPLTDDDRWPWLRRIAKWIGEQEAAGRDAVVTCSALRHAYRELLSTGHPSVWFAHLTAPTAEITRRIGGRRDHYMPPALLQSQLDTLEPLTAEEPGAAVDATGTPTDIAGRVLRQLPR